MLWVWNIYFFIIIRILETSSIQNNFGANNIRFIPYNKPFYTDTTQPYQNGLQFSGRHYRQNSGSTGLNFDWENGLREATTQALIKEGSRDVNLRKHVFGAPILGKQEKATPFGDIAVLARGQLYITSRGYLFNQDPYQNDCEGCHNEYAKNEIWRPKTSEQLIALWTVKRIRHRPVREDSLPRFEVEFTVSPISHQHRIQGQITEEGQFNYAIPGHVFLMKGDAQKSLENHLHPEKPGHLLAQGADGRKYILQSFPNSFSQRPAYSTGYATQPPTYYPHKQPARTTQSTTQLLTDETLTEEEEKKIYQALLNILHKKTSTNQPQEQQATTAQSSNIPSTQISENTLVQLPDGSLVPITELSSPFITKTTPGFVTVRFPDSATPQNHATSHKSSPQNVPRKPPPSKPMYTRPSVTQPAPPSAVYKPQTSVSQHAQPQTPTQPPKTTFHFFSAAEEHDDIFEPPSTKPSGQFSGQHNFLADTTLAQSQDTSTTVRQQSTSTTRKVTPTVMFPTTSKERVTAQSPMTHYISSTQIVTQQPTTKQQTTPRKLTPEMKFLTTSKEYATSQLPTTFVVHSTQFLTHKPPKISTVNPVTATVQLPTDAETQFSTIRPVFTSQNSFYPTGYSTTTFTRPKQTDGVSLQFPSTNYPTTTFKRPTSTEQINSRIPTTVFIEPSSQKVTMTTTQFKEPLVTSTKITSEIITELSSRPPTTIQSSTTTPPPTERLVETTLGITKVMNTFTNDTPGTIFIVSEPAQDTEVTYPSIQSFDRTKKTTAQTTESVLTTEKETSTPQHIITTIGADGTVSVKSKPIDTTIRTTTLRQRPTKKDKSKITTEKSDFLIETDLGPSKTPLYKYPSKDYSDDEIFGTTSPSATKPSVTKKITKPYKTSDVELALFGKERYTRNFRNRGLKYLGKSLIANNTGSVKYSSSYASPPKFIAKSSTETLDEKPTETENKTTAPPPNTSQSVLTSISYKIHKRKSRIFKTTKGNLETTTQAMAVTTEILETIINNNLDDNILNFKDSDTSLDEFASKLFSQAKGIEFLDQTTTTAPILNTPKYMRRRSYVPRSKKVLRKKKTRNSVNS